MVWINDVLHSQGSLLRLTFENCEYEDFFFQIPKLLPRRIDTIGGTSYIGVHSNKFKGATYNERKQVVLENWIFTINKFTSDFCH